MFQSFKQRSTQPELMDDPNIDFATFRACLSDLAIVNTLTLGYRPNMRWIRRIIKHAKTHSPLSIIDVGCGGGDTLRNVARFAKQHNLQINLTGLDINPWSKKYADKVAPSSLNIKFETANIFDFQSDSRVDFVMSSLFTHHLNDEELVSFLKWMEQHATQGWLINDLHRHPLAYFLFKYLSRLFGFNYMVQHDGPISVARAFTKADWITYLTAANIPLNQVEIRWFFPFRYSITRKKP